MITTTLLSTAAATTGIQNDTQEGPGNNEIVEALFNYLNDKLNDAMGLLNAPDADIKSLGFQDNLADLISALPALANSIATSLIAFALIPVSASAHSGVL